MYFNKFSSGTILALLALSGMLFLVPFAVSAHGATSNASLPTIKTTPTLVIQETPTALVEAVTNPASNAYAITTVTLIAPTGWNFTDASNVALTLGALNTWCAAAGYGFTSVAVSKTALECGTGNLPPGFTATFTGGVVNLQGPASPKSASPVTGVFSTSISDASGNGAYTGPSWTETSIWASGAPHTETAPTITVSGLTSTYTAGSAPITLTATSSSTQPGVPVTFSATSGTYPTAGFTTSFAPTSGLTSNTGTVSTSWQPSNHAGDTTQITGTITGSAIAGTSGFSEPTVAAAPTKVTFYLGVPAFPVTHYVTSFATIGGAIDANIPASSITYAATDAFANPAVGVTGGTLTAANGFFGGVPATTTCLEASTCGGYGMVPQYSQGGIFGTIGQIGATLTGTTGGNPFSVSGTTGFISTSTFATSATFSAPTVAPVGAGSTTTYTLGPLSPVQSGVPVKIQVCVHSSCSTTTKGYSGTFSNGLSSISGATNSTGRFGAVFSVSTVLHAVVVMNATISKPVDGSSNPQFFTSSTSIAVSTIPGAAAALAVYATFGKGQGSGDEGPSTIYATSGANLYVAALLTDAYGNIVTNISPQQIQVNLVPSGVSGGGLLSATQIYIASGTFSTNDTSSFGPVAWTLPTTLGASTVTASAVVAGKAVSGKTTVTTISPLPTITVTSPKPVSGVIYSSSPFVTFAGKANASLGYPAPFVGSGTDYPTAVTITSLGYKVNANHWLSSSIAPGNQIVWSAPVTLATGLSTIQFNVTDSKSNAAFSASYQVLVDSVAPTFTFASATTNNGCIGVTVGTAAGDFNATSFKATYGGVAVPSASISWSGTQTLGSPSTLVATICGLVAGSATLVVSGSNYTLVSGTNTETLTVTVAFANSITFVTSGATYGTVGAYKGVTVSATNSWSTTQTIVVYATLKSGTSIYVAQGTTTLAPGQTAPVFCVDLQTVPAGSYSVTFAAVTTSNFAVSAPVPAITLVAT